MQLDQVVEIVRSEVGDLLEGAEEARDKYLLAITTDAERAIRDGDDPGLMEIRAQGEALARAQGIAAKQGAWDTVFRVVGVAVKVALGGQS